MGMLDLFRRNAVPAKAAKKRSYAAGGLGRLLNSWAVRNVSADSAIFESLTKVRARARELAINEPYAARFLSMLRNNVLGPAGVVLQSKVRNPDGKLDRAANERVEGAWRQWGKRGGCDVTGTLSLRDCEILFLETMARDGEVLVRMVMGYPNAYGFALQFLDADHLDEQLNVLLANGNEIRMGVEKNKWGRPVAYHLFTAHPGDTAWFSHATRRHYERIPAEEIIHGFRADRPHQTRGMSWLAPGMVAVHHMGKFVEAELVASRIGAAKMGFYKTVDGEYAGDDEEHGDPISEVEPGVFEVLPAGMEFQAFDPDRPAGSFEPFIKRALKGIASAWGVPYVSLANDLEGVNYSSIRQGELEARDAWRGMQRLVIEQFHERIFPKWLLMALTVNLPLPLEKFDKFNAAHWRPRGFGFIDPLKEIMAARESMDALVKSPSQFVAEQGGDFQEVVDQIKADRETMKAAGLDVPSASKQPASKKPEEEDDDE